LDAKHHEKQISSQLSKTNANISVLIIKKLLQQLINELPFDGTLDDWKTKPISFQKGREYLTLTKLSQC
jgi:hypothetical protein